MIQSQLIWIETNPVFPDHIPQKTVVGLKMELAILDLSSKAIVRLHTTIDKTVEKCKDFYMKNDFHT